MSKRSWSVPVKNQLKSYEFSGQIAVKIVKGKLLTRNWSNCLLVYSDVAAHSWYFFIFFKLFSIVASTSLISLRVKSDRWELTNLFQSFNQISRVLQFLGEFLSLCNVVHNRYEIVRSVAAHIDCHEYLPFDFVAELTSEIVIKSVLIK